jgi:phage gp46-like protein
MDFRIDMVDGVPEMTLEKSPDIRNNVILSLLVEQGAWFFNPKFGSRLHLLRREKLTARAVDLAVSYAREALQWLIDCGKALSVDVTAEADRTMVAGRVLLSVQVRQANGAQVAFKHFVEVA